MKLTRRKLTLHEITAKWNRKFQIHDINAIEGKNICKYMKLTPINILEKMSFSKREK